MKKSITVFLVIALFFTSFTQFLQFPKAHAEESTSVIIVDCVDDGMGNIRLVTNNNGERLQYYEYDSYGNQLRGGNTSDLRYRGEEFNDQAGLYYLRARYYDPVTGRFISKDPIKGAMTMPQTQNPYVYSLNNPVNFSDPSGLWYVDVGISSGLIGPVGGGTGVQINDKGITPYIAGGVVTPGKGVTVIYSPDDPQQNLTTINFAGNLILAGNASYPYTSEPVRFTSGEFSGGLGFPAGASATVNRTFDTYCW